MQRYLPLLLLSLSLASPALAAGVDIAWDNCRGEPGAVSLKQFACGNNLGSESLWISFESPVSASSMGRLEVAIDFHTAGGGTLPVWWDFEDLASCRRGGLRVDTEGGSRPRLVRASSPRRTDRPGSSTASTTCCPRRTPGAW